MRNEKVEALQQYLDGQIDACKEEAQRLTEEVRTDESVFAVVRTNIFDIFRTILSVGEEMCGEDDAKLCEFIQSRLLQIPQNWKESLQRARAHNDVKMAHIERIKLEAVMDIQKEFHRIWGLEA